MPFVPFSELGYDGPRRDLFIIPPLCASGLSSHFTWYAPPGSLKHLVYSGKALVYDHNLTCEASQNNSWLGPRSSP